MGRQALASCSCFVLGVAFAWWLLGSMAFDPSAVQWLLSGDRGQSFLGWHLARNEPLGFPLGRIPSYVHPTGASLALTDSYPWFSLLLLPASPLFGEVFQHAGLWLALCYGLLALFSFHVLHFLTRDVLGSVVATSVVVANPVLLARRGHLSLCAHWLIVAALLLYLTSAVPESRRWFRVKAILLVLLASGTHPYLATMVLAIVTAAAWSNRRSAASAIASTLLLLATAWLGFHSFGYFTGAESTAAGFGFYSANVLALFDPNGQSTILPDLPNGGGQYEGFAYLGLAPLLVASFAGIAITRRALRSEPVLVRTHPPLRLGALLVVVAGCAVFALSSRPMLGTIELARLGDVYALFEPLPSIFRSSGRFVWPLVYVAIFGALTLLRLSVSRTLTFSLLCLLALGAQAADSWHEYSRRSVAMQALRSPYRPLAAPEWRGIGRDYREIRLVPPAVVDTGCDGGIYPRSYYMPFALVAGVEGMRVNSGHLSRSPRGIEASCAAQVRAFERGDLEPDVVYVAARDLYDRISVDAFPATCGSLDGYRVCVSNARRTRLLDRLASRTEGTLSGSEE
ncbi:MAG: hypothetical protein FJ144_19030 [Deltaproteobacteria bacterium]|nr:hypothetical protein [Deltaproteobacteria bacterium]